MATLTLEHVSKLFHGGVRAVDDLSLAADDGELLVLVGPSGCGKTTTLRMIAGLETPSSGSIAIDMRPAHHLRPKDRDVAMVFQHGGLYPHLTAGGNMAFSLKLRGTPRSEIVRRVREAAELLDLNALLDRRVGELSGGQRQRVALGRAIVRQPKLFLFDEPLSSLDAGLRAAMRGEIRHLQSRLGTTTVYVTHDQTEAMTLGTRIAVMAAGRLQQVADPETIYHRPANRFVAELIGTPPMNFLEGRVERTDGGLCFVANGESRQSVGQVANLPETRQIRQSAPRVASSPALPIPAAFVEMLEPHLDRPLTFGIRAEHLAIAAGEVSGDVPRLAAVVERIERTGPQQHVYLRAGGHLLVASMPSTDYRVNAPVELLMPPERWHWFDRNGGRRIGDGIRHETQ
jgi:multiple sugar transport system ATP-binding protein